MTCSSCPGENGASYTAAAGGQAEGQVFKSQELASALLLMAAFAGLYLFFPYMVGEFQKLVVWVYSQQPEQLVSIAGLSGIVVTVVLSFCA